MQGGGWGWGLELRLRKRLIKIYISWKEVFFFLCLFVSREFLAEEENLESVLNKAFLEINKAYERHARQSADGRYKSILLARVWRFFVFAQ